MATKLRFCRMGIEDIVASIRLIVEVDSVDDD